MTAKKIGDGIEWSEDGVDDPTETHTQDAVHDVVDATEPEQDDELPAHLVFVKLHDPDDPHDPHDPHDPRGALSVMERDVLDAVDGVRSLGEIADVLAIHVRGARKIATSLMERGLIRTRTS